MEVYRKSEFARGSCIDLHRPTNFVVIVIFVSVALANSDFSYNFGATHKHTHTHIHTPWAKLFVGSRNESHRRLWITAMPKRNADMRSTQLHRRHNLQSGALIHHLLNREESMRHQVPDKTLSILCVYIYLKIFEKVEKGNVKDRMK